MNTDTILDVVCRHFSVDRERLINAGQTEDECRLRNSFLLACTYVGISNRKACLAVKRNHATIYNSLDAIIKEAQQVLRVRITLFNIINEIKQHEKEDPKFRATNALYRRIVDAIL